MFPVRNPISANMTLLETILKSDKKHFDTVKTWICQEKQQFSPKVWPLVKHIIQDQETHVEKKFVTIVLRHVVILSSDWSTPQY